MKVLIVLVLAATVFARPDDTYDSKYDNFNVDDVINNKLLFRNYLLCFIRTGKCTPEGKQIRGWIPDAVNTSCAKCSEKQKVLVAKSITAAKINFAKEYNELVSQHDPQGKRVAELQAFLTKYSA